MLSRLQYISQGLTPEEQINNIREVLDAGGKFIQLRFKNAGKADLIKTAERAKHFCDACKAMLLINDHVDIAKDINASGVHLGLNDMDVISARAILGNEKIIGGTANTLEDALMRAEEKCDYVGLGPFRFTTTKEKLSPVLGLNGYKKVMMELSDRKINIPVYAIGGIVLEDVEEILESGIYGVALSGALTGQTDKKQWIENFNSIANEKINYSRQGI